MVAGAAAAAPSLFGWMDGWIEEESGRSCSFSDGVCGGGGGGLKSILCGRETYDETVWENMSVYVCQMYGLERVRQEEQQVEATTKGQQQCNVSRN